MKKITIPLSDQFSPLQPPKSNINKGKNSQSAVWRRCDFGRKLEALKLLSIHQDFLSSSEDKKRGVFSLLHRRIAPRSVRSDAPSPRSFRTSYFLESGTSPPYRTLASSPRLLLPYHPQRKNDQAPNPLSRFSPILLYLPHPQKAHNPKS